MITDDTQTSETSDESVVVETTTEKDQGDGQVHQPSSDEGVDTSKTETQKETEEGGNTSEEGETLESKLNEPDTVTYTKSKAYPKTTGTDLILRESGKALVTAQHTYDDIDKMFNISGNVDPNPKLFFLGL